MNSIAMYEYHTDGRMKAQKHAVAVAQAVPPTIPFDTH